MAQHYTKATTEAMIFCPHCMKVTMWRVADGRRQWCQACHEQKRVETAKANQAAAEEKERREAQGSLF